MIETVRLYGKLTPGPCVPGSIRRHVFPPFRDIFVLACVLRSPGGRPSESSRIVGVLFFRRVVAHIDDRNNDRHRAIFSSFVFSLRFQKNKSSPRNADGYRCTRYARAHSGYRQRTRVRFGGISKKVTPGLTVVDDALYEKIPNTKKANQTETHASLRIVRAYELQKVEKKTIDSAGISR